MTEQLWLSFFRAALTGACANPNIDLARDASQYAANVADEAIEENTRRFVRPEEVQT